MIVQRLKKILKSKYLEPVLRLLSNGVSPAEISMTIAGTFVLAIFPVIGATTLLCTLFAVKFKLNLPLTQLINYTLSPLQIMLLVPFMEIGMYIFQAGRPGFSTTQIVYMVSTDPLTAINLLWTSTMKAIIVWCVTAPFIYTMIYKTVLPVVKRIVPVRQES